MLLLVKNANETKALEISTFDAIFRLSMHICDQYGLGSEARTEIEAPVSLTVMRAA